MKKLTGIFLATSPKVLLIAAVSILSLSGVEVPWALMYEICSGLSPASLRAWFIA